MPKKAYIKTFGCQMNVHDSEKMAGVLRDEGYELVANQKDADVIIMNTYIDALRSGTGEA